MAERPNVDNLIRSNPNVDRKKLDEGRELLRRIREHKGGVTKYKLPPPPSRRRVIVGEDPGKDPRTVELKRRG
jgi:hypothetical protein